MKNPDNNCLDFCYNKMYDKNERTKFNERKIITF